ncbi:MAG: hypothetical protein ACI88A_002834 [Paraglaciecola sp.]|jgi:hypothetical protein
MSEGIVLQGRLMQAKNADKDTPLVVCAHGSESNGRKSAKNTHSLVVVPMSVTHFYSHYSRANPSSKKRSAHCFYLPNIFPSTQGTYIFASQ